jgi:hypothetical protein
MDRQETVPTPALDLFGKRPCGKGYLAKSQNLAPLTDLE